MNLTRREVTYEIETLKGGELSESARRSRTRNPTTRERPSIPSNGLRLLAHKTSCVLGYRKGAGDDAPSTFRVRLDVEISSPTGVGAKQIVTIVRAYGALYSGRPKLRSTARPTRARESVRLYTPH